MGLKKLEKEVVTNTEMMDQEKIIDILIQQNYEDHFVTYNKGKYLISPTFKKAIEAGNEKFGKNVGFVVSRIAKDEINFLEESA